MAVPGLPEPVSSAAPAANTAAAQQAIFPVLAPGNQSSEFYLALIIVAAIVGALWDGKLDPALASTLLGLIVSGYPALRTWLKAQHVGAVASVLAAQGGRGGLALGALAGAVGADNETMGQSDKETGMTQGTAGFATAGGFVRAGTLAALALFSAFALLAVVYFSGCAQAPYYVSEINGTVDTSKDGGSITGGGVGVTISPNPYYPLPSTTGLTK
ncbi:MAG: hypothetical protein P4L99_20845 [Chthoniobacter sp.]|nr:hypothetical protein [Chthoniobacter sp.]